MLDWIRCIALMSLGLFLFSCGLFGYEFKIEKDKIHIAWGYKYWKSRRDILNIKNVQNSSIKIKK